MGGCAQQYPVDVSIAWGRAAAGRQAAGGRPGREAPNHRGKEAEASAVADAQAGV